jgi:hypothetical protein
MLSDGCIIQSQHFGWEDVHFVLDQHADLDFKVLAHWNNSLCDNTWYLFHLFNTSDYTLSNQNS